MNTGIYDRHIRLPVARENSADDFFLLLLTNRQKLCIGIGDGSKFLQEHDQLHYLGVPLLGGRRFFRSYVLDLLSDSTSAAPGETRYFRQLFTLSLKPQYVLMLPELDVIASAS